MVSGWFALGAALSAAFGTYVLLPIFTQLAWEGRSARPNFAGRPVPVGVGLLPAAVVVVVVGAYATLDLYPLRMAMAVVFLAGSLGLLGWIDDQWGNRSVRGLRGHLQAVWRGKWTTGAVKAVGGGGACLLTAWLVLTWDALEPEGRVSGALLNHDSLQNAVIVLRCVGQVVLAAGLMAGSANAINLLDVRPGRAWKALLIGWLIVGGAVFFTSIQTAYEASLPLGDAVWLLVVSNLGALLVYGPWDLQARAMMGDAGANPLGGLLGLGIVLATPLWGQVLWLSLLVVLHVVSERCSVSEVIAASPFLTRLDHLGRAAEEVSARRANRKRG